MAGMNEKMVVLQVNSNKIRAKAQKPHPSRANVRRRARRKQLIAMMLGIGTLCVAAAVLVVLLGQGNASPKGQVQLVNQVGPLANGGPPYIVALDAGHGGIDSGGQGLIDEVLLTEGTVRALAVLLEADPNYTPVLTRQYGQNATRTERAEEAAQQGAMLLLSVHGNYDDVYGSSGFECFPKPPGREFSEESIRFATMLAEEMGGAGSRLRGENGVRFMYFKDNGGASERVIHEVSDKKVYDYQSFGMVEHPTCPAVLAEQCFVTNADDVAAFGNEAGFEKAARCYYRAICRYFGTEPMG